VRRESMVDHAGVRFIRRRAEGGHQYFISHAGATTLDGWIPLAVTAAAVAIMDPMSERTGLAQLRTGTEGQAEVYLQLEPSAYLLDLGRVAESARVRLNGQELGILFARPFRVETGPLRRTGNELEIEVTNLSANRIRDWDVRRVPWKVFEDINFVGIDYK